MGGQVWATGANRMGDEQSVSVTRAHCEDGRSQSTAARHSGDFGIYPKAVRSHREALSRRGYDGTSAFRVKGGPGGGWLLLTLGFGRRSHVVPPRVGKPRPDLTSIHQPAPAGPWASVLDTESVFPS